MRRSAATVLAAATFLVLLLSAFAPAQAQDADPEAPLVIRQVDATDPAAVRVTFAYEGDRNDLRELSLRENGDTVETTSAVPLSDRRGLGVVLVIDASTSMEQGGLFEPVRDAAREFIAAKAPQDQIAIISFNQEVRVVQDFSADEAALTDAVEEIAVADNTALYDAIVRASALAEDTELQPNIVVFSDGGDTASTADAAKASAAINRSGAATFAVGVPNSGFDILSQIAERSGGTSALASDAADISALFTSVNQSLRRQYEVTFPSRAAEGSVDLELRVGSAVAAGEFVAGGTADGADTLRPQPVAKPSGPSFLRTSTGLWLGLGLIALAVVIAVLSLGETFAGRTNTLNTALQPYGEGFVADSEFDSIDELGDGRAQQLAQTPMLQRAVEATGQFAERRGFLTKIEGQLERANLPLRPAEAIFFYFAGVVLVALLLLAITGNLFGAAIGIVLIAMLPPAILSFLAGRRQKQFNSLLPDTLQLLASTLRAGYSLMQGVEAVSAEVSEPVGRELRRVVTEARLGRPLEESMESVADRMDSGDFAWAVMAIRIQREVGGNLAELLVTVADTMTERERLRRDVNALTAEGKVSAIVLGLLPLGLGAFIYSANPDYMQPLFEKTLGQILLGGSLVLMLFGFWWMKKTIEIEI
jgi:tight adherence protein B